MTYTYPYGYSGNPQGMGQMLTWDEMMTKKTVRYLHPEVLRRFHALIEFGASVGVPLGVGTGWRVQPNPPPPGFAKPGNSWHESCPCSPESATALAIDTVPNISWDWMEINAKAYGFQTFRYVNNEPWHIQPIEIPKSRSYATSLPPLNTSFPLPGQPGPVEPSSGAYNVEAVRWTVKNGDEGKMVWRCQFACQLNMNSDLPIIDGDFGPQTEEAVKTIQRHYGLKVDGICGPDTWKILETITEG